MYKKCEEILNKLECEGRIKISDYEFPPKQELKLKLKDLLEDEVDEKYYLSEEMVDKIRYSKFAQEKSRIQEKEYSDTLLARDYKDPKCVEVNRKYGIFDTEKSTHQAGSVYDENGLSPTLDTMQGGYRQPCVEIKNNYVSDKYNEFIEKNGYIPEMFNPYNKSEIKDVAPTQTTQSGSITSSATILVKNNTEKGYLEAYEGDGVYTNVSTKRGTVQKEMIQTLTTFQDKGVVMNDLRIRKLTPKECWRLMGFTDEEFEKAEKVNSNSQLYKQAGNSICVPVLIAILNNLLKGD